MAHIKGFQKFRPSKIGSKYPAGHTFVPVHMCFDVKFDLRSKSRLVAGGNMTGSRDEEAYCGMGKIDTFRTYFLLGQLDDL